MAIYKYLFYTDFLQNSSFEHLRVRQCAKHWIYRCKRKKIQLLPSRGLQSFWKRLRWRRKWLHMKEQNYNSKASLKSYLLNRTMKLKERMPLCQAALCIVSGEHSICQCLKAAKKLSCSKTEVSEPGIRGRQWLKMR